MQDVHDLLEAVHDKATFLAFATALKEDFIESCEQEKLRPSSPYSDTAANGWSNTSIDAFLDGAIASGALDDVEPDEGRPASNPWKLFAEFLYCGKIYE